MRAVVVDGRFQAKKEFRATPSEWKGLVRPSAPENMLDGADIVRDVRLRLPAQTVDATLARTRRVDWASRWSIRWSIR
jgi:hypothetical protein